MELLDTAKLERIRGSDQWRVLCDFHVELDDGRTVTVPHGFITDKASVPLGLIIKRDDKYIIDGALVHDYLYVKQMIDDVWIKRKEADEILYKICRYSGMSWLKAKVVWLGVRSGGWVYWNKRAKLLGNSHYV